MKTRVYLDNNVWDFLFERGIDVCGELPQDEFEVCITREVEFEIEAIPREKEKLRAFIENAVKRCVTVQIRFGFYDPQHSESDQRVGGFGVGGLVSVPEHDFYELHRGRLGTEKKESTGLYQEEADLALASTSFDAVVLTLDRDGGPLRKAHAAGGHVVFLNEFDKSQLSLADFVKSRIPPVEQPPA